MSRGTGRKPFNSGLYQATRLAMIGEGVPIDLADRAAAVIASDDTNKPNLGRSKEDQDFVWQAWHYLVKPKS